MHRTAISARTARRSAPAQMDGWFSVIPKSFFWKGLHHEDPLDR